MSERMCEYCGRKSTKRNKVEKVEVSEEIDKREYQYVCKECLEDMAADYESECS